MPSGSVEDILQRANDALAAERLFEPAGNSALDHYLAAIDAAAADESGGGEKRARRLTDAMAQVDPREQIQLAIADIFPFGLIWVERAIADNNRADAERVLGLLERAQPESSSLARLRDLLAQPEPPAGVETSPAVSAQAAIANTVATANGQLADRATAVTNSTNSGPINPSIQSDTTLTSALPPADNADAIPAESVASSQTLARSDPPASAGAGPAAISATGMQPHSINANTASSSNSVTSPRPAATRAPPAPIVISQAAPRYPPRALKQRLEGWVLVGFTIRPDGRVDDVSVLNAEPAGVFDREAVGSMQRWQFQPPGQAITAQRRIDFKLGR